MGIGPPSGRRSAGDRQARLVFMNTKVKAVGSTRVKSGSEEAE